MYIYTIKKWKNDRTMPTKKRKGHLKKRTKEESWMPMKQKKYKQKKWRKNHECQWNKRNILKISIYIYIFNVIRIIRQDININFLIEIFMNQYPFIIILINVSPDECFPFVLAALFTNLSVKSMKHNIMMPIWEWKMDLDGIDWWTSLIVWPQEKTRKD